MDARTPVADSSTEMISSLIRNVKGNAEYFTGALSLVTGSALDICDSGDIDQEKAMKYLDELDGVARSISRLIQTNLSRISALNIVLDSIKNINSADSACETGNLYEKYTSELKRNMSSDTEIEKNKYYLYYKRTLWERQNPNIPFDQSNTIPTNEPGDDYVALLNSQIKLVCPLTKTSLKDPVTSVSCLHFFSKDAVREHIRVSECSTPKAKSRCPVTGCNAFISESVLIESPYLERDVCIHGEDNSTQNISSASKTYYFIDRG